MNVFVEIIFHCFWFLSLNTLMKGSLAAKSGRSHAVSASLLTLDRVAALSTSESEFSLCRIY